MKLKLEFEVFVQYLIVEIGLTEKNTSLITVLPQALKIMTKKASNFWKSESENWFAQIFRKDLTDRKLERITAAKKMFLVSRSLVFSPKVQTANLYSLPN